VSDRAQRRSRAVGYFEALGAATLWGSSGIFAVALFRTGLPPESVALLRPAVGVAFLGLLLAIASPRSLRLDLRAMLVLGVGGGAAVALFQIAYLLSTDAVGVPTTVALLYLSPAIVVAASGPLLGEWPSGRRIALVAITLTGVWLSVLGADETTPQFGSTGTLWGIGAALGYAGYTLFGRYASPRFGSARTVFYSTLGSCVLLLIVLPGAGVRLALPPTGASWALILGFGLLTISAAHTLFFDALARVQAARVSIAAAVEPAVAALLATLLLDQGLAPVGWLGIVLVVIGVAGVGFTREADG